MLIICIVELVIEVGIFDGVFNVVFGFGEMVGVVIGFYFDVDCVVFIGLIEVGCYFLCYLVDFNFKEVLLECGGKSLVIVMVDVDDLDVVVIGICEGIFWNGGQNCSVNLWFIVQWFVEDELLECIVECSCDWVVGDFLVVEMIMGVMIEEVYLDKVLSYIVDVYEVGLMCVVGGNWVCEESGGWFVEFIVFIDVDFNSCLVCEEVFGLVLVVIVFDIFEEVICLVNDIDYGLVGIIYIIDLWIVYLVVWVIRVGMVVVNCYGEGDIIILFGGFKQLGFGGWDKLIVVYEQYMELKIIWMDLFQILWEL